MSVRRDIIQADCRLVGSYSGLVDFGIVHGAHADVDDDGACVPLVPCWFRVVLGVRRSRHGARSSASRRNWSARLGTTKDARKIGRKLFPVHRKATVWPSAASNVPVSYTHLTLPTKRIV